MSVSILDHFSNLKDPRQQWKVLYPLQEILLLILCATLSNADDFVEMEHWDKEKIDVLRRFLNFSNGITAHNTLKDVMNALPAKDFSNCFISWVDSLRKNSPEFVTIDGKASRRAHNKRQGLNPWRLVSAWASRQRLVLGQEACAEKLNEITAIPALLERLELTGALVSIDAMGCQTKIASAIRKKGDDYLLALKGNRPLLFKEVDLFFHQGVESSKVDGHKTIEGDHGRIERCPYRICHENGFYPTNIFHDDLMRLRTGHGPANLATVRHIVLIIIKSINDKASLKVRRKKIGWNEGYLFNAITS